MARDCELPDVCRKCKGEGHIARDCELPDTCNRCGAEGHMVKDCEQPEQTRQMTDEDGKIREIYVPKEAGDDVLFDSTITTGINFNKYENIPCKVSGENALKPISSFQSAGLRSLLLVSSFRISGLQVYYF